MLVIFPFEETFYQKNGVEAEFVGHPLAELPLPTVSRKQFAAENGLDPARTWIGVLPGSRLREIRDHLPEMLEAAWELALNTPSDAYPSETFEFLVPLASTLDAAQRAVVAQLAEKYGGGLDVRFVNDARAALFHARASVVASGTATVEAALIGNPFVVIYRVSSLTFAIAKRMVKVPYVAMVNLIAGRQVAPELIQRDFTAANIVQHIRRLLPSMMKELGTVRDALKKRRSGGREMPGAIERVAAIAIKEMGKKQRTGTRD
jgi:lipid-A-disaccharide synthase